MEAFADCLTRIEQYRYAAETTVLRPVKDRPLYCFFYATVTQDRRSRRRMLDRLSEEGTISGMLRSQIPEKCP